MNQSIPAVLYVDDELNSLQSFKASFRRSFTVFTASSGQEAQEILANNEIHVLISDERMPGMNGTELLEAALRHNPAQVRILLTAYSDFEILQQAVNKGYIFKYLCKPWNDDELARSILEAHALYQKNLREGSEKLAEYEERKLQLELQIRQLEEAVERKKLMMEQLMMND
jgi:response regulator RpfG family c-di-GMP phosphodiesterase